MPDRTLLLTFPLLLAAPCFAQVDVAPVLPQTPPAQESAADWSNHRGDPGLRGVAPGRLGDVLERAWSFKTGDVVLSSPVIADGLVFVGSSDQHVYALELESGKVRWKYKTDDMVDAPPLVHEGRVFVGSADFVFYCFDAATGALRWKKETGDRILGGANVVRMDDGSSRIVVGSYDNKLHCFDPHTGKELWTYATDNYINGTPAVVDGNVVFGGCDAVLHVVSAKTGKKVMQLPLGDECHVASSVAIAGGRVYLGHYGNELTCVRIDGAKVEWRYPSRQAFMSSPAVTADRVLIGGRDKKMHCVNRADGKPVWTFPTRRKIDGSPVVCGDKVVFGSGDGRVYLVGLADGKQVASYEIGDGVFSSPAVAGGHVVVGASDGSIYALRTFAKKDGGR